MDERNGRKRDGGKGEGSRERMEKLPTLGFKFGYTLAYCQSVIVIYTLVQ